MGKQKERKIKGKSFFTGFKNFITKGNVIDLAIGVIIGGSFGKIVTSLVNDVIMPPIGVLVGGVDFKELVITLKKADILNNIPAVTINYGNFIMTMIEFLIIAFTIYAALTLVIRRKSFLEKVEKEKADMAKSLEKTEEVKVQEVIISEEILLLREIRDSLNKK